MYMCVYIYLMHVCIYVESYMCQEQRIYADRNKNSGNIWGDWLGNHRRAPSGLLEILYSETHGIK